MKFNKSSLLLSLLLFSPIIAQQPKNNIPSKSSELCNLGGLALSYLVTLSTGGLIGTVTGGLCGILVTDEKKAPKDLQLFVAPINIAIILSEIATRNLIINELQKDLDTQQITYNKNIMTRTAWILSWLAFLTVMNTKL